MKPSVPYRRRKAAAQYIEEHWGLPCSATSLEKYAVIGGGPAFHKAGHFPLYAEADLDAWAVVKIGKRVNSTSEYPPKLNPEPIAA
jgi:hypothetical protein